MTMSIITMEKTDDIILSELEADIHAQINAGYERLDVEQWMTLSPWGRRQTERKFRDRFLTSPARYFRDIQSDIAEELLTNGEDVLSASTKSGFTSPGRLHDATVVRYGLTPGELRRRGAGVTINFGFFQTPIGVVLIGATTRGICTLFLCGAHPDHEALADKIDELKRGFPNAQLEEEPEAVQIYADQLVAFLTDRSPEFCPPMDIIQGTTFQREVWNALRDLKTGEVVTYSDIAERIGKPSSVRAVASAIGRNNLAIAIPCHRVVRKDGTLSGYRWGIAWKTRLLEIEAEMNKT